MHNILLAYMSRMAQLTYSNAKVFVFGEGTKLPYQSVLDL